MRPVKPLPIQPFVPAAEPFPPTLLVPKPGGGPRADLLIGAPHNSDVVGVACCGTPSDQLLVFELIFEIALRNRKKQSTINDCPTTQLEMHSRFLPCKIGLRSRWIEAPC